MADLCSTVHQDLLPGPPALSMIVCCSGSSSWYSLACAALVADRMRDNSFAKAAFGPRSSLGPTPPTELVPD